MSAAVVILTLVSAALVWQIRALSRRLDALPDTLSTLLREERAAGQDELREAVAAKAAAAVREIVNHQHQLAALVRDATAAAEARTRIGEAAIAETLAALETSVAILHELRDLLGIIDPARPTQPTPEAGTAAAPKPSRPPPQASGVHRKPNIGPPPSGDSGDDGVFGLHEPLQLPEPLRVLLPPPPRGEGGP